MSHWYSPIDGHLLAQVEYKDPKRPGQFRDATLADARTLGYLPSVTTVLQLLAKPGLVRWQVEQGIKATLSADDGWFIEYTDKELIQRLLTKSEEYTHWTADFGTAVHWWVNKKLRAVETNELPPLIPGAEEIADGVLDWLGSNGYEFSLTEHRFTRPDLGYAGTVDMVGSHNGAPCVVDIKTQEAPLTPYLEHALQLAGYDYALDSAWASCQCGICNDRERSGAGRYQVPWPRERISIIANRLTPGDIKEHIWIDKDSTVEQTNARYDRIWTGLLELWFMLNQYDPRGGMDASAKLED